LLLRIHPTPGRRGDRPKAETLLAVSKDLSHIIVDVDPLRAFIADDLGVIEHIKANLGCTAKPTIEGASTRDATRLSASSAISNASDESPSPVRRPSPPSWAPSISHAP
jgi:hypothetical protein